MGRMTELEIDKLEDEIARLNYDYRVEREVARIQGAGEEWKPLAFRDKPTVKVSDKYLSILLESCVFDSWAFTPNYAKRCGMGNQLTFACLRALEVAGRAKHQFVQKSCRDQSKWLVMKP